MQYIQGLHISNVQSYLSKLDNYGGNMNDREKLGARIRELRKRLNLTQEQLGTRCGLSYKYLGNVERGRENPTFDALVKLSKSLDIEPWELLFFEHTEKDPASLKKELLSLLSKSDPQTLQQATKILRSLLR